MSSMTRDRFSTGVHHRARQISDKKKPDWEIVRRKDRFNDKSRMLNQTCQNPVSDTPDSIESGGSGLSVRRTLR